MHLASGFYSYQPAGGLLYRIFRPQLRRRLGLGADGGVDGNEGKLK